MSNLKTAHMLITSSTKRWTTSWKLWRLDVQLLNAGQMYRARQVVISKWILVIINSFSQLINSFSHLQLIQAWMIGWLVGFFPCARGSFWPPVVRWKSWRIPMLWPSLCDLEALNSWWNAPLLTPGALTVETPPQEKMLMKLYKYVRIYKYKIVVKEWSSLFSCLFFHSCF